MPHHPQAGTAAVNPMAAPSGCPTAHDDADMGYECALPYLMASLNPGSEPLSLHLTDAGE